MNAGSPEALDPGEGAADLWCNPDMQHRGGSSENSRGADAIHKQTNDEVPAPAEILVVMPCSKGPCDLRNVRHGLAIVEDVHPRSKYP